MILQYFLQIIRMKFLQLSPLQAFQNRIYSFQVHLVAALYIDAIVLIIILSNLENPISTTLFISNYYLLLVIFLQNSFGFD